MQDYIDFANRQAYAKERKNNIDAGSGVISVQPTLGPAALSYKVNVTLIHEQYVYKSKEQKRLDL